jgi:hypothetical protein
MFVIICLATALAMLVPVMLVAIRHEVRLRRIRMIEALNDNLNFDKDAATGRQRDRSVASFEFVKAKYTVDLDPPPRGCAVTPVQLRRLKFDDEGVLERYIAGLHWWELRSNWAILRAAVPYVLLCAVGFCAVALLFLKPAEVVACLDAACPQGRRLVLETGSRQFHVFVAAFCGAFLFTVRLFVKAIAVFDLSAVTVSRAALHILLNTIVATLAYGMMVTVNPGAPLPEAGPAWPVTAFWPAVAFVFGFVPDAGFLFLLNKAASIAGIVKSADERFASEVRTTPLDVIDGVDFFIRFRLEEANVSEVQSLACANPLMLYVETPYGLYQTVDWVAQAQLCTVVGVERFLLLRQVNIRTIFDLERAVLGRQATPALQKMVGGILLADTKEALALAHLGGRSFATMGLLAKSRATFAEFSAEAMLEVGRDLDASGRNPALEHLVRVILDDLHIHRLRQIWIQIGEQIGQATDAFEDTRALPAATPVPAIAAPSPPPARE